MLSFPMLVVGTGAVYNFVGRYPDSRSSLTAWLQLMNLNDYKHFNHLKQTFGSVDYVKPYTVFDISGNKYRLISLIDYQSTTVAVKNVLTHVEYDKDKWRNK